jgi:hypothetical protein
MTDRPAGRNRLDALARRLARRRRGGIPPVSKEVYDEMRKDLDIEHGDALNIKGGLASYGVACGYPGYVCQPGYRCLAGKCYPPA